MTEIEARFRGRRGTFPLDIAFTCPAHGVTGLFGPSGGGKTTVLRCLAGLERLEDGYLDVAGDIWQGPGRFLPAHKRPVGYVFQQAQLFSHMPVRANLEYGLRRAGDAETVIRLDDVVGLMGLGDLLVRAPATLSGGQAQRVAIGRALLSQPRLLLMDEPLSALDQKSKDDILPYLETLSRVLAIPTIYVSHDIAEIERLAGHIVLVSNEGKVAAAGPIAELATDLSLPLAHLNEAAALLTVTVGSYDAAYGLTEARVGGEPFFVPGELGEAGTERRLRVRAADVSLVKEAPGATSILNVLPARVAGSEKTAANQMLVVLTVGGEGEGVRLLSTVTRKSWDRLALKPGDAVFAQVKGMSLADR